MNDIIIVLVLLSVVLIGIRLVNGRQKHRASMPKAPFPDVWRNILIQHVGFYNALTPEERLRFETEVHKFIWNTKIRGVDTKIEDLDRVLVAASAVIPVFGFPGFEYHSLDEVILYPNTFNLNHETSGEDRNISGMVGSGYMEGKMILSKTSLYKGFKNDSDKQNVGVHEFVHLIDKEDGKIDGIPEILMQNQNAVPWIELIKTKIDEIYEDKSDINPYASTNPSEFLTVVSEYFFERPKLLKKKHPQLYTALEVIFNQKMAQKHLNMLKKNHSGRNALCSCGSGKKYKHCCGRL